MSGFADIHESHYDVNKLHGRTGEIEQVLSYVLKQVLAEAD